jgi:hypothetical protein
MQLLNDSANGCDRTRSRCCVRIPTVQCGTPAHAGKLIIFARADFVNVLRISHHDGQRLAPAIG